jgi:hypothetical protein
MKFGKKKKEAFFTLGVGPIFGPKYAVGKSREEIPNSVVIKLLVKIVNEIFFK